MTICANADAEVVRAKHARLHEPHIAPLVELDVSFSPRAMQVPSCAVSRGVDVDVAEPGAITITASGPDLFAPARPEALERPEFRVVVGNAFARIGVRVRARSAGSSAVMTERSGGGRRRRTGQQPRTRQVLVRLSSDEWLLVVEAAGRDGLAVGAWIGGLATRVAGGETDVLPVSWTDLVRELVRVRADLLALTAALQSRPSAGDPGDEPGIDAAGLGAAVGDLIGQLDELLDAVIADGDV